MNEDEKKGDKENVGEVEKEVKKKRWGMRTMRRLTGFSCHPTVGKTIGLYPRL